MLQNQLPSLQRGIKKLFQNQQLWYTIFIAFLILAAFIFIANQFVGIAKDAQDRLVNQRLGAMQDSLVEFAPDYLGYETDILQDRIKKIAFQNETVRDFRVVEYQNENPVIVASIKNNEVGTIDDTNSSLYKLAGLNTDRSTTIPAVEGGERVFITIRPILDQYEDQIGAVLTKQSLSDADIQISESIQTSIFIFILIVILIMFLFFRHARIIDYTSLYKKLEDIDRLKDDFISMASHELRTPLTIIRGYAEDLNEIPRMPKAAKEDIERIDIAARQLDSLVNDMLDVSRIEQGRMKIETGRVESKVFIDIVSEVVSGLVPAAEEKGLKLNLQQKGLTPESALNLDLAKFRQLVVNLVGNAVKYTMKGEVNVTLSEVGPDIELRVRDTGVGMSAEEQKGLFNKFYRIRNEDTENVRGTGLGLWITKQIIELMGGTVSVESIKGVGTHFIVKFKRV